MSCNKIDYQFYGDGSISTHVVVLLENVAEHSTRLSPTVILVFQLPEANPEAHKGTEAIGWQIVSFCEKL